MSTSALLIRFFLYSLVLIILVEIAQFLLRFPLLQRIGWMLFFFSMYPNALNFCKINDRQFTGREKIEVLWWSGIMIWLFILAAMGLELVQQGYSFWSAFSRFGQGLAALVALVSLGAVYLAIHSAQKAFEKL